MRSRMHATVIAVAVAASALLLQGSAAGAAADSETSRHAGRTMAFDVALSPFDYTDLGVKGISSADIIVFHDRLSEAGTPVGDEVGSCVLVDKEGLANCTGVIRLDGRGTIAFAFVNAPPPHKVLAVTGGSEDFRAARGDGALDEHGDGTATLTLRLRGQLY